LGQTRGYVGGIGKTSHYLEKGVLAKGNAEQVEKIIRIARELELEPVTPQGAREILGLKGIDKVNF
jgi:uncharacterized protein (DUF849 family)